MGFDDAVIDREVTVSRGSAGCRCPCLAVVEVCDHTTSGGGVRPVWAIHRAIQHVERRLQPHQGQGVAVFVRGESNNLLW